MVSCVYNLPSFSCTAIVDLVGVKGIFVQVSVFSINWNCLFMSSGRLLSSPLHDMDGLFSIGSMPLTGLLNRNVARLGNLVLIGVSIVLMVI